MNQPQQLQAEQAARVLTLFSQHPPLIHCMTNDVVQGFTANVLLAVGASPAMVIDQQEAAQFSAIASGLLINVGTLTRSRSAAMLAAVTAATQQQRPWTLDPVAVGALSLRSDFCQQLLAYHPAAIRGNASEIMALAGQTISGRGVDSLHGSLQAVEAGHLLARATQAVVVISGEQDYLCDGENTLTVSGGDPLMTRVVGTGCALSALVAAFTTLAGSRLENLATACWLFARAGEQARRQAAGPGSFRSHFIDALWQLSAQEVR